MENNYHIMIIFCRFLLTLYHLKSRTMCKEYINRIKIALAERNKTNRWLAEKTGKSDITISRWVQNKTQPSLEQLVEIAKVLEISPKDLINDIRQ